MAEKHIFSTGQLMVTPLPQLTLSAARTSRNAHAYTYPPGNLIDSDTTSLADLWGAGQTNPDYIRLDMGASLKVSGLTLRNSSVVPSPSTSVPLYVWVTDNAAFDPASGGGQFLDPSYPTAGAQTLSFPGGTQTGRYIYLTGGLANNTAFYGDIYPVLVTSPVELALVQDVTLDLTFTRKDLFAPQNVSAFAVDTADHQGVPSLKIANASVSARALQLLIASQLAAFAPGGQIPAYDRNTLSGATFKLPFMQAVLTLTATDGKNVVVTFRKCKASGVQWPFKVTDFLVQNVTLYAYTDSATGIVYTVDYQN